MTGADLTTFAKKQPIGVACGVVALVCAVLLYLGSDSVDERRSKAEERAQTDHAIENNVTSSKDLDQQTQALQTSVKEMEARLIHAGQLAINLQYFYRLESETGVKMTDVHQGGDPQKVSAGKATYLAVPFQVAIQGDFKQVLDFIQRVENGQRIAHFTSVSFNKAASETLGPKAFTVSMGIEFLGVQ